LRIADCGLRIDWRLSICPVQGVQQRRQRDPADCRVTVLWKAEREEDARRSG